MSFVPPEQLDLHFDPPEPMRRSDRARLRRSQDRARRSNEPVDLVGRNLLGRSVQRDHPIGGRAAPAARSNFVLSIAQRANQRVADMAPAANYDRSHRFAWLGAGPRDNHQRNRKLRWKQDLARPFMLLGGCG